MEEKIVEVLEYFRQFKYPPALDEIWIFLEKKVTKKVLQKTLEQMVELRKLGVRSYGLSGEQRYALKKNRDFVITYRRKEKISTKKIEKIAFYCQLLAFFPQIRLIGLSGSVAMDNAEKKDDIDLFIITGKNRLFTGRLIAVVMSYVLGVRRKRIQINQRTEDKVCLNLFFDERNMEVPKFKQTLYVAHEVLQMKPLTVKGNIYEEFLKANKWIYKIFPNAEFPIFNFQFSIKSKFLKFKHFKFISNFKFQIKNYLTNKIEFVLKKLQMHFINKHKTTELILDSQLWFFPDDFEKRIHK